MKEEDKHMVNLKMEELVASLKIDTKDDNWEIELSKNLDHMTKLYRIYLGIGFFFLLGFALLGFITLFLDRDAHSILAIEVNRSYLYIFILIAFISNIFFMAGKMEVKKERMITLLFLHNLNK